MSHAPGLLGTCVSGHCSSAATRASWARSSASSKSRTIRVSPAITLGDSIRQTASIVRCISVTVTATDHTIYDLFSASQNQPDRVLVLTGANRLADLVHLTNLCLAFPSGPVL